MSGGAVDHERKKRRVGDDLNLLQVVSNSNEHVWDLIFPPKSRILLLRVSKSVHAIVNDLGLYFEYIVPENLRWSDEHDPYKVVLCDNLPLMASKYKLRYLRWRYDSLTYQSGSKCVCFNSRGVFTDLLTLDLGYHRIPSQNEFDSLMLHTMTNLKYLNLLACGVGGKYVVPEAVKASVTNLTVLDLSYSRPDKSPSSLLWTVPWLKRCTALTRLRMDSVCTHFPPTDSSEFFDAISKVQSLSFASNMLRDEEVNDADTISQCTALVSLDLSMNFMTNKCAGVLATRLANLPRLKTLDISNNPNMSSVAVDMLRKSLPVTSVLSEILS